MTINLPKDLESSVRAEVLSGHFATEDDMVAEAVRTYLRQRNQGQSAVGKAATAQKPIWEVIEEENRSIPPEVWDALPTDLSAQHDHYIYGTPKRPAE
jgi:Arc/MetJ-type ribon-helix-helix transcriptional regulator